MSEDKWSEDREAEMRWLQTEAAIDKLSKLYLELETEMDEQFGKQRAINEGLRLLVDAEFGIGTKLDALHALREALK